MKLLTYSARFFAMGAVMAWYGLRYALGRLRTLLVAKGEPRRRAVSHLRGRILRQMFARLGATFVKLGQVLSTRPDLLDEETIDELRHLQDRLPPFPGAIARRVIAEDLGRPVDAIFEWFDDKPVAAASVAQVHKARLPDGTEVAVKVLRPDVRRKVLRDAAILELFAKMLAWHPRIRLSDPVGHMREFERGIIGQTDLRGELEHYRCFAENFRGFDGVRFPRCFPELSGPRVLTMEFIHGDKIDALPASVDKKRLAQRLELAMFKMCFEHGYLHADLHPGNMLVERASGDLVIFDAGLAKQLEGDLLAQFTDFTRCLVAGTAADFVAHLKRFHTYMGEPNWQVVEQDIIPFVASARAQNTGQLELGKFFNELYALARKHNVRPLPEVVLVMVGIVTSEGIGKQLNPENNLFQAISGFLLPLMAKRGLLPGQPVA